MTRRELTERVADGCTRADVGREFGLSVWQVSRLAKKLGVRFPTRRAEILRRAAVLDLVASGFDTAAAVAARLGVHQSLACRWAGELVRAGALARAAPEPGRRWGRLVVVP